MKTIAYRYWNKENPVFYVAEIKGKVGDWGYTAEANKAANLTPSQRKRFAADCRFCGSNASFLTITA